MSTAEIARPGMLARLRDGDLAAGPSRPATALVGLLSVLVLYAAFDHGAVSVAAGARVQAAVAIITTAVAAIWLWSGRLRFAAPRLALAGLAALLAFGVWSGVTLVWSVAPEQTWTELNRILTYALVLALAVIAGASHRRAAELVAGGALVAVLAVTLYALGQKLFPGIHIAGLFSLNQTQLVPRLQEPFGYWNALGLFVALGVPLSLAVTVDRTRPARLRLCALASVELMALVIGLTYSRGAVLALVCGLVVAVALNGARLRSLMWLAPACLAAVPPLVVGLTTHSLTSVSVPLAQRERAGLVLAAVLVLSVLALWATGHQLLTLERRVSIEPEQARRAGGALAGLLGVALVCGVIAVALSGRGLGGNVSNAWNSFTTTRSVGNYDPGRLLSADSANRWVWWKEAASAFGDRPVGGWGAGSFGVVHLLYRHDSLSVEQPHSAPLQFLAETGIVGALLALTATASLIAAGVGGVRRRSGSERLLAAALLGGVVIYAVHALYDWDWDIPGVTLPALLYAGVLVGARRRARVAERPLEARTADEPLPLTSTPSALGPVARSLMLAAVTAAMCAFTLSGLIPSVAASKASAALVAASSTSHNAISRAQDDATLATRLDPLSDAGPLASATIALRLGQPARSQADVLEAIRRDPNDVEAWQRLVFIEVLLHNDLGVFEAVQRVAKLDPHGVSSKAVVEGAYQAVRR